MEIGESSSMDDNEGIEEDFQKLFEKLFVSCSKAHGRTKREETEALADKKFFLADPGSDWYKHLSQPGGCDKLLEMVKDEPGLVRQKGKGNVSVLHKAVHHQYVALVHHVVEEMFDDKGISTHLQDELTLGDLLCEKDDRGITAVMLAAVIGPWDGIGIFERAIVKCDQNEKTDAYEVDTFNYYSNCSGLVGQDRLQARSFREFEDPAARSRAGKNVVRAVEKFKAAGRRAAEKFKAAGRQADHKFSGYLDVIKPILKKVLVNSNNDFDISKLKEAFEMRFDYNNARKEEFFFHFLCGCFEPYKSDDGSRQFRWRESAARVARKIVHEIKDRPDAKDSMFDLFDNLDPQGRTPLHVAGMAGFEVYKKYKTSNCGIVDQVLGLIPEGETFDRCVNVRDGAGRTIFHQLCILKSTTDWQHVLNNGRVDFSARVDLNARATRDFRLYKNDPFGFGRKAHSLLHWRSPRDWIEDMPLQLEEEFYPTALHLLILHGHDDLFECFLKSKGHIIDVNARLCRGSLKANLTPVQLAAALGRETMVDLLLKQKEVKDNGKLHGPRDEANKYSAIHVAAAYKSLKVLQTLLENKEIYDPMIAARRCKQESPLHLVALTRKLPDPISLEDTMLEGDVNIIQRCLYKCKGLNDDLQKNYDANDIVCINIMLQVGFDIWCSDKDGREPYPGVGASIEAYKWWYERVASEVSNYKQKLNGAIGAISVIAALVATASFIGPLQPPLGYDDVEDYVQSSYVLIKMYFVCNGLSFYFAVASLLAAVTPAIPMLRESTQDEIRRSQRSSKIAMSLLLISIIAILVSFSSSSIGVMRPKPENDRRMMFWTIGVGAATCVSILVLFTSRMISQILNQPDLVKRFSRSIRCLLTKRLSKETMSS